MAHVIESAIRGFHVYKDIWDPKLNEILQTKRELNNYVDKHAVAVCRGDETVGHVPREISKVSWHFILHGGQIQCVVLGPRRHSHEAGGMEVPCTMAFSGPLPLVEKLKTML